MIRCAIHRAAGKESNSPALPTPLLRTCGDSPVKAVEIGAHVRISERSARTGGRHIRNGRPIREIRRSLDREGNSSSARERPLQLAIREPIDGQARRRDWSAETPHRVERRIVERAEFSTDQNLAAGRKHDRTDRIIWTGTGIAHRFKAAVAIDPRQATPWLAIIGAEVPADDGSAVILQRDRINRLAQVDPCSRREIAVESAFGCQLRKPGARETMIRAKIAAKQNAAVRAQNELVDAFARSNARLRCKITFHFPTVAQPRDAIASHTRAERKDAAGQNFSVRLKSERSCARTVSGSDAGIETVIERPRAVEASYTPAQFVIDDDKVASNYDLGIRLHQNRVYRRIDVQEMIERSIDRAVRVEPGEVALINSQARIEGTANQNFPIRLDGDGADIRASRKADIRGRKRIKSRIERPIRVQPRNIRDADATNRSERSPDQNLPVRLQRHRVDIRTRIEPRIEAQINGTRLCNHSTGHQQKKHPSNKVED